MCSPDVTQEAFSTTVHLEEYVPKADSLRAIKVIFDEALTSIGCGSMRPFWLCPRRSSP